MITYVLNSEKELVNSIQGTVNQHESMVDKMIIYIPNTFNGEDLSGYIFTIKYITADNILHTETLVVADDLYNDAYLKLTLPITTKITKIPGDVRFRLIAKNNNTYVMITSESVLRVTPVESVYTFDEGGTPDPDPVIPTGDIPDGLTLSKTLDGIQLSLNGKPIGTEIKLKTIYGKTDDALNGEMFTVTEI